MKKDFMLSELKKIHFIGAGGVSMSGLMKWCIYNGITTSGSDKVRSEETDVLEKLGAKIFIGHSAENLGDAEAVVYTSAVADDNEELVAAKMRGLLVIKRSELLGEILAQYPRSVGVAGSHGKTTVTAMLWEIFETAGEAPAVFLGGEYGERGNFCAGGKCNGGNGRDNGGRVTKNGSIADGDIRGAEKKFAVAEACEYKSNFLDLKPYIRIILNVDDDHLESFGGKAAEIAAFRKFAASGISVVNADDEGATLAAGENSATFGIENPATFTAKRVRRREGAAGYSFTAYEYGRKLGRITLKVSGRHNVYDALAALAAARLCGVSFAAIKSALSAFSGVKRRNEEIGELFGLKVYADYAHHPSEIKATLIAKRELGRSPIVVFQPHTYSRTRLLKGEFIEALGGEPRLIIYKTYPAREEYEEGGDAKTLYGELFRLAEKRWQSSAKFIEREKNSSSGGRVECEKYSECAGCIAPLYAETEEELIKAISLRAVGSPKTGTAGVAVGTAEAGVRKDGKENGGKENDGEKKKGAKRADEILFVGAGDIYYIGKRLCERYGKLRS